MKIIKAIVTMIDASLRRVVLFFLSAYQWLLSPLLSHCCRFHPTCSEYAKIVFHRFSFFRACWLTLSRLARCHPFCQGGPDFPPD